MGKRLGKPLRAVRGLRPLVYTVTDDALLQLLTACRVRPLPFPAEELWWQRQQQYVLIVRRPLSAAQQALLDETATLSGWGESAAAAARVGLCLTANGTVLPAPPAAST